MRLLNPVCLLFLEKMSLFAVKLYILNILKRGFVPFFDSSLMFGAFFVQSYFILFKFSPLKVFNPVRFKEFDRQG